MLFLMTDTLNEFLKNSAVGLVKRAGQIIKSVKNNFMILQFLPISFCRFDLYLIILII